MNPKLYASAIEKKKGPIFIPFTVLGDPDKKTSLSIIQALIENGADSLELGLPFSDPPADGPVIQAADTRALAAGITVDDCFDLLTSTRSMTDIPIGLLVYFNLVLQRGIDKFYKDCAESGVTSVLVADIPLEHSEEVISIAKKYGIAPVFIISELTSEERMQKIAAIAEGYLYVVSYLGVTGVEESVLEEKISAILARARKYTDLPLCIGFGISSPESATSAIKAGVDGVIVGSRIVREVPNIENVATICRELSEAVRNAA